MQATKITLEDKGQDFLELYVSEDRIVIDAKPFQADIWRGAYIPVSDKNMVKIGELCPIHHPPHIEFGYLNYKVENIEQVEIEL